MDARIALPASHNWRTLGERHRTVRSVSPGQQRSLQSYHSPPIPCMAE